jgi:hypothetical protein
MKKLALFMISAIALWACNKISNKEVYKQSAPVATEKKVLLEVYTGWRCVNCAEKTEIGMNNIKTKGYENNVIIMEIHAGFFAIPEEGVTLDFTTPEGDALYEESKISSNPVGVVSRSIFGNSIIISPSSWVDGVFATLTKDTAYAPLELDISIEYSDVSRKMAVKANAILTRDINKGIDIIAYITEDSIINPQQLPKTTEFPDGVDYNFVHRHVLRKKLEAKINATLLTKGNVNDKFDKSFTTYTLPDNWKDYHCAVVVIAVNKSDGKVIQVQEMKII